MRVALSSPIRLELHFHDSESFNGLALMWGQYLPFGISYHYNPFLGAC